MTIIMERAKATTMCAGMEGYDAELVLEDIENGEFVNYYVHANGYFIEPYFRVTTNSVFDFITNLSDVNPGEPEIVEEYEGLEAARDSRFYKYFVTAKRLLDDICPVTPTRTRRASVDG